MGGTQLDYQRLLLTKKVFNSKQFLLQSFVVSL